VLRVWHARALFDQGFLDELEAIFLPKPKAPVPVGTVPQVDAKDADYQGVTEDTPVEDVDGIPIPDFQAEQMLSHETLKDSAGNQAVAREEDVDGEPLVDSPAALIEKSDDTGEKTKEPVDPVDEDMDGAPMDEEEVDGVPLDAEDVDGVPLDADDA
jgi:hypothetical protein